LRGQEGVQQLPHSEPGAQAKEPEKKPKEKEVDYSIDGHKLIYHPYRVGRWLAHENVYPIYMEVGPAARCNQNCIYCAFDYLGHSGPLLHTKTLQCALANAAAHGLRSVMLAGEGEPLAHPAIAEIAGHARGVGLDVAVTTNGVLLTQSLGEALLPHLSWIRFSLDACSPDTYQLIHRCPREHYITVLKHIGQTIWLKKTKGLPVTIGLQALLLPENRDEICDLAQMASGLELVEYLVIKPFSRHPLMLSKRDITYQDMLALGEELEHFNREGFRVIFRERAMKKQGQPRQYEQCLGLPFFTYIAATGDVYACSAFLGNQNLVYGNIYDQSFRAIWEGKRRQEVLRRVSELNIENCREMCRLDEINSYLWKLTHRELVPHVNFI